MPIQTHTPPWESTEGDPFPAHTPDPIACPAGAWGDEDGALEVQTGVCDYFSVVQGTHGPLAPGDTLTATIWHLGLDAEVSAEAHVALWIDGLVLWETYAPIPSTAEIWEIAIPIEEEWPTESLVGVHLHNHGFNSWRMTDLLRVR